MTEYILGSSDHELERLELQHEVWGEVTQRFLDRLGLPEGGHVMDAGAGPGFVVETLRERVGVGGRVTAVDVSPRWVSHLRDVAKARDWRNVDVVESDVGDLTGYQVDGIFLRWVLAFLSDRQRVVSQLASCLAPGGVLGIVDYNHEGVSLFPRSDSFDAVIRGVRDFYRSRGGDPWVMGQINRLFVDAGLEPCVFEPYVIAGGPESPAFRWADAFFPFHTQGMVDAGVLGRGDREAFMREWDARKADASTLFFSPIVVGAAARRR